MPTESRSPDTSPATIRRAEERDVPAIRALYALLHEAHANNHPQVFAATVGSEVTSLDLGATTSNNDVLMVVAERNGEIVAAAQAVLNEHFGSAELRARRTVYLTHLITRPDARRVGHGRALMAAVAAWVRAKKAERIELCVWEGSVEAAAFYRALGYRTIAQHLAFTP